MAISFFPRYLFHTKRHSPLWVIPTILVCFKIFRHYADTPFIRSMNRLNNSKYRISQHARFPLTFSGFSRQKSVIHTIKCSLFKEIQISSSFHDEQITSTEIFLLGKGFWYKLCVSGCRNEFVLRCILSFVASRKKTEKKIICLDLHYLLI